MRAIAERVGVADRALRQLDGEQRQDTAAHPARGGGAAQADHQRDGQRHGEPGQLAVDPGDLFDVEAVAGGFRGPAGSGMRSVSAPEAALPCGL